MSKDDPRFRRWAYAIEAAALSFVFGTGLVSFLAFF